MAANSHPQLRRATTSVLVAVALISGAILLLGDRFDPAPGYALSQPVHVEAHIAACVADENMRLINPDRERCRPGERELTSEHTDPAEPAALSGHPGPGLVSLAAMPGVAGPPGPSGPQGPPGPPGPAGPPGSVAGKNAPAGPAPDGRSAAAAGPGPAGAPGPAGPPGPAGRAGVDGVSGFEIVTAKVAVAGRQSAAGQARCPAGKMAVGGGVLPDPDGPGRAGAEDRMDVVISAPLLPGGGDGGYGWTATVKNTSGTSPLSVVVAAICVTLR